MISAKGPLRLLRYTLAAGALAMAGCATGMVDASRPATLREAFGKCFLVGAALEPSIVDGREPVTRALAVKHFNSFTATNVMKWASLQPSPGTFLFERSDALVALAEANDAKVHGHVLLWHSQTPRWVFEGENGQPATREQLLARLQEHIQKVVGRYKGRIKSWDVVNEAINDDGSLRDSRWLRIIGPDYIEKAFEYAHAADPEAELYYNDYNMHLPEKVKKITAMVADMKAKGIPITGIGDQGHFHVGSPSVAQVARAWDAYIATGLRLSITELDVSVLPWPNNVPVGADISTVGEFRAELDPYAGGMPPQRSAELAAHYGELFKALVARRDKIDRVTFWGVADGDSWKNHFPVRGRTDYPLLFDRAGEPKLAFDAVMTEAKGCN